MLRLINNLKTALLLGSLMGLFLFAGVMIGGQQGLIVAFILGGMTNIFAYFFSDKLALATMRARQVTEHEAPGLIRLVRELSQRAGLPMPRVYICPHQAPNAFATGRNPRNAAIAVTEGLLRLVDNQELAGVIGHELAHVKHRDILISSIAATIAGAISALGYLFYFIPMGGDNRRGGNPLAALLMIILAPLAAMLIQAAISRKREFNADNYGAELCGNPNYLASALIKLHNYSQRIPMAVPLDSQRNMFIVEPFTSKEALSLFDTHPKLEARLQALNNMS